MQSPELPITEYPREWYLPELPQTGHTVHVRQGRGGGWESVVTGVLRPYLAGERRLVGVGRRKRRDRKIVPRRRRVHVSWT